MSLQLQGLLPPAALSAQQLQEVGSGRRRALEVRPALALLSVRWPVPDGCAVTW